MGVVDIGTSCGRFDEVGLGVRRIESLVGDSAGILLAVSIMAVGFHRCRRKLQMRYRDFVVKQNPLGDRLFYVEDLLVVISS